MKTPQINAHYFDVIDTAEKAYWLGYIWKTGEFLTLEEKPVFRLKYMYVIKEQMDRFRMDTNCHYPIQLIASREQYATQDTFAFYIDDPHFVSTLQDCWAIVKMKDKVPEKWVRDFLRGIVDNKGIIYFTKRKRADKSISKSYYLKFIGMPDFLLYLNQLLIKLRFTETNYTFSKTEVTGESSMLVGGNQKIYTFLRWIYADNDGPVSDFKYQLYEQLKRYITTDPHVLRNKEYQLIAKKVEEEGICCQEGCSEPIFIKKDKLCKTHYGKLYRDRQKNKKKTKPKKPPKEILLKEPVIEMTQEKKTENKPAYSSLRVDPKDFYCLEASPMEHQMIADLLGYMEKEFPTVGHPLLGTIAVKYTRDDVLRFALRAAWERFLKGETK